jgi:hypothetical protein
MNTEIYNGDLELIASGTLIVNSQVPTKLTLGTGNESLDFIFIFENKEGDPNIPGIRSRALTNTSIEIVFINFYNPVGTFIKELWKTGNIENRVLYFGYFVKSFPDTKLKSFEYTFYLGEAVPNG